VGNTVENIVVVGASAAGSTAAEALRSRGFAGRITMIGEEPHAPYDRPPLSKQLLLGTAGKSDVTLRGWSHFQDLDINIQAGVKAVGADIKRKEVELADGTTVPWDRLIIATGVTPRSLPVGTSKVPVHVLRTVDDALALQDALQGARRILVIGGGVLGTEVAATIRALNIDVVLASPSGLPMEAVIGKGIARQILTMLDDHDVEIRLGGAGRVRAVDAHSMGAIVHFEAGGPVIVDLIIVAIGSIPSVSWLHGSGIRVHDGVVCQDDCSAGDGIYAVGDVARWHNRRFGVSMRIEHRTNATEQALHAAHAITEGSTTPYMPVPYFWSDQFGMKLQVHGYLREHDEMHVVEGDLAAGRMVALYRRGDYLTGVLAVGAAKAARLWRSRVEDQLLWKDALEQA
jgi:NAD(P)H-nitrite reductase large subunit